MAPKLHPTESNVSNEVVASFAIEVDQAQREVSEATGRKRAVLKRAKDAGVNTRALLAALSLKKSNEDQVTLDMRDTLQYVAVIAPHQRLSQGDLFSRPVRPLNKKAQQKVELWDAEERGYQTGLAGGTMEDAVFAPGTESYVAFERGYVRGQTAIADRMGENASQASAARGKPRVGKMAAAGDDTEDPDPDEDEEPEEDERPPAWAR